MGRVYHSGSTIAKSKLIKLVIASQIKNREMASMPGMLDALIILLMRKLFSILGYDWGNLLNIVIMGWRIDYLLFCDFIDIWNDTFTGFGEVGGHIFPSEPSFCTTPTHMDSK